MGAFFGLGGISDFVNPSLPKTNFLRFGEVQILLIFSNFSRRRSRRRIFDDFRQFLAALELLGWPHGLPRSSFGPLLGHFFGVLGLFWGGSADLVWYI